jgi:hypothetical protein
MRGDMSADLADPPRAQIARAHRAKVARFLSADDVGESARGS